MRVRRTVAPFDETDIGFDGVDLDEAAIVSFGGSDPLTVSVWYDQSGSSNDASQATATAQPFIYDGSAVITENGKPAVLFSGAQYVDSPTITTTDVTIFGVLDGGGIPIQPIGTPDHTENSFYFDRGTNIQVRSRGNTVNSTITAQIDYKSLYYKNDGSNHEVAVNDQTAAVTNPIARIRNRLGARTALSSYFTGHLYEFVIYDADESSNRTGIDTNINDYFSIYP
jgi:hypothetical protein